MAILGVAVVTLIQLFSISLRSTKKSSDYTRGLIHARSLMDEALSVPTVEDINGSFEFDDGFTATREVEETSLILDDGGGGGGGGEDATRLYRITVTVSWPPSGEARLSATRLIGEETP